MNPLVNKNYFDWLTRQIEVQGGLPRTYLDLFCRMYQTEFTWTVDGDDNRCQDGKDLRTYFVEETHVIHEPFPEYVSILEVLIALSRKVAFHAGGEPSLWAWILLENLGLTKWHDPLASYAIADINDHLYMLVWRTYGANGRGGFFPLNEPREDQRRIEIWKQMQAYVNEIDIPG